MQHWYETQQQGMQHYCKDIALSVFLREGGTKFWSTAFCN